jgi:hypothetical protein
VGLKLNAVQEALVYYEALQVVFIGPDMDVHQLVARARFVL